MVARGRVQNGVIVLDGGVRLPDGQEQTVLVEATAPATRPTTGGHRHSVLDIRPVNLGQFLPTPPEGFDALGEMLEGRP